MQLPLMNLLGLASSAVGLIQKAFTQGNAKGNFDAELASALTGKTGGKDSLLKLLSGKGSMDEEAFQAFLATPAGMILLQFMTDLKEMGVQSSDIQALLNGKGAQVSDDAVKTILAQTGLSQDEVAALMSDASGSAGIKEQLSQSFKSVIEKLASREGVDSATLLKLAASDSATIDALVERITSGAALPQDQPVAEANGGDVLAEALKNQDTQALVDMIRSNAVVSADEIRVLVAHAVKKALQASSAAAAGAGSSVSQGIAVKAGEMVDTAESTLGISRDALKDLLFQTDPALREKAVEQVTAQVNTYLKSNEGRTLKPEVMDVLSLLKGAMSETEFSGIDNSLKLWQTPPVHIDARMSFDREMYTALAQNLGTSDAAGQYESHMKQIIDQIRQNLPSHLKNGEGQLTLKLNPPMLGRVDVSMTMQDGQIQAAFRTDQSITRDILVQNMSILKEALADQGIKAAQFSVTTMFDERAPRSSYTLAGQGQGHGFGHNRQQGGSTDSGRSFREDEGAIYARANYSGLVDGSLDIFA